MTEVATINHPYLREGIEPRVFQQTILNTCIKKNTLVVLPTGTGKTIISILHIAYLLQTGELGNDKYVLILAPTKPLVNQHVNLLRSLLKIPSNKIVEFSGAVSPENRKKIVKKAMIIVGTPQTIRNDIIHSHLDLRNCLLAYFDEAHRATGEYDYVHIAGLLHHYNPTARIVALTASPGADKESIITICRNLFIEAIESRTKNDPEVRQYIQEVGFEQIEVPLPLEFEEILATINLLGERETEILRKSNATQKEFAFLYKGELLKIKKQLAENFRANYFEIMAANRLIYIMILRETIESQGIPSAANLLANWKEKKGKSIKGLLNLEEFREIIDRVELLKSRGIVHPKLLYLVEILNKVEMSASRVLIFCNLRATCYAISKALIEQGLDAKPFVGQARSKKGGLSQKKQIQILNAFRRNEFQILVSTSVLEEGLDVDECDLVIFYDATPSAIRKIQRVGRTGRKRKGSVIILTTHHTVDTIAHFVSNARERKMNKLLEDISWLKEELKKEPKTSQLKFEPIQQPVEKHSSIEASLNEEEESDERLEKEMMLEERTINEQSENSTNVGTKLSSFREAIDSVEKWEREKQRKQEQQSLETNKESTVKKKAQKAKKPAHKDDEKPIKIIIDSREKNNKILCYLKKQEIALEFRQLDLGDYILSDRVAVEYKKGEDLLSSIIDGRIFEQLGELQNAYQVPILILEGFPSGGIHPEAIAGAIASISLDFGVSIIQTQSSEESAALLKRIAIREQKTKKRQVLVRKASKISNPKEIAVRIIGSFPGINRTLSTRLLESFGSIREVINASEEELVKIDGFASKKSKKFLKLVNYKC